MKIYIAARAKTRQTEVAEIVKRLNDMGHTITFDWASNNQRILKPYRYPKHRKSNKAAIPKMLNAAAEADVFILLDEPGLRGAYIELGAFLYQTFKYPGDRKVYIVGPDSHEREHLFESHDFVKFVNSIDDVYKDLELSI